MKNFDYLKINKISETEQFVHVIHRHWFNMFQQFFIFLCAIALLIGSYAVTKIFFPQFSEQSFYSLFLFIENTFLLTIWIYLYLIWIDYYFDIWIITTERIINIEQKGLFHREVREIPLAKVQTVNTDVAGIVPSMFNFGDLHVSSAGEEEPLLFRYVPDPNNIRNEIMNLRQKIAGNSQAL